MITGNMSNTLYRLEPCIIMHIKIHDASTPEEFSLIIFIKIYRDKIIIKAGAEQCQSQGSAS